ncbi:hypothetical protein [Mesorhizobium carmichaelinearum]|uniref:hypothetical protein n=1 Tax=Mesorhizobium carmichaelinearum TaxID=1208188 RepID=UPI00117FACB9|nr:hypothetical protein [Mesorhizobium carmichaelinearum]
MLSEHLGQIIELHVAGVENRPEMVVESVFETIAPFHNIREWRRRRNRLSRCPLPVGIRHHPERNHRPAEDSPGSAAGERKILELAWRCPEGKAKAGKSGNLAWDTTMEDGARVLGNVEVKGRTLHLLTNSAARAEKGRALIQGALNDLVGRPLTEIRTVKQMIAERPARDKDTAGPELPPEIATKVVHEFLDKQYRETLDEPVGMLGNISPRTAVKTPEGQKKAAEWLKYLENRTASQPDPDDPMATYDFRWIWKELGIVNLRR